MRKNKYITPAAIGCLLLFAAIGLYTIAKDIDRTKSNRDIALTGAGESAILLPADSNELDSVQKVTEEEKAAIESEVLKISNIYRAIYLNAEKVASPYFGIDNIGQKDIDEIENVLISEGYPIINSDSIYPDYLENPDGVYTFWENVKNQKDAETTIRSISTSGSLSYRCFQFLDGKASCLLAGADWNENNEIEVNYVEKREILNWDMTYEQDFYYQDVYLDRHWEATKLIRLHPVNKELYDLTLKYIMPIGYHNVNLFLLNWNADNYGNLCFNDLFDCLYRVENDEYLYADDYPYYTEPYNHSAIPAQLFEDTILPYFDITIEEFRERALYDAQSNTYPWQDISCDNILYYPSLIPEVTDCIKVDENTIKLIVNVMCLDKQTDNLFIHEVTIRTLSDGKFKYIGNEITYTGDIEIPSAQARIPVQRFSEEDTDENS